MASYQARLFWSHILAPYHDFFISISLNSTSFKNSRHCILAKDQKGDLTDIWVSLKKKKNHEHELMVASKKFQLGKQFHDIFNSLKKDTRLLVPIKQIF